MHVPPQRVGDRARNGTKAVRTERPHVSVARVMATRPVKTDIQYEGLNQMLNDDAGQEAFFYRLQLQGLSVQSAMLILRQCAVPQLNYLLRCTPPRCIREHAARFDERVLDAAYEKLAIPEEHA